VKAVSSSLHVSAPNSEGIRDADKEDITAFLDTLQRKAPKTRATYRESAEAFATFTALKGMPLLEHVEREHVEAFCDSLHAKGNKPATIRNRQAGLRALFNWMLEYDVRKAHPMARIKLEPIPEGLQPHYEDADILAVLDAIPAKGDPLALRDRAVILLLLDTGLRAQELCDLKIGDLDREARRAAIVSGKGGKGRRVHYDTATASAIFRYVRRRGGFEALGPAAPLFAARDGEPLAFNGLRMLMERRFRSAGVGFHGIHGWRRSAAIAYLDDGGDPMGLKELMGWNSLSMVYKYTKATAQERALREHEDHSPVARLMEKERKR